MEKHIYNGNTLVSVSFDAYGVYNFPAQFDEEGHEITPAKPYFTIYFSHLLNAEGKIDGTTDAFQQACDNYIYHVVDWLYPTTGRIIIPNQIILDDPNIRALIDYCDAHAIKYSIFEVDTHVYVSFLYQQHYDLLHQYPSVIFEGQIDIIPTAPENPI